MKQQIPENEINLYFDELASGWKLYVLIQEKWEFLGIFGSKEAALEWLHNA